MVRSQAEWLTYLGSAPYQAAPVDFSAEMIIGASWQTSCAQTYCGPGGAKYTLTSVTLSASDLKVSMIDYEENDVMCLVVDAPLFGVVMAAAVPRVQGSVIFCMTCNSCNPPYGFPRGCFYLDNPFD